MKKPSPKKLTLSRETVRALESDPLALVQGGLTERTCSAVGEDLCITRAV